jgi:integrase
MNREWEGQGESRFKGGSKEQQRMARARDKVVPNPKLKLLDQVREVMRLKHYSIRTERCYCDWIRRFIGFHRMKSRQELLEGAEAKIELFLSDLAVNGRVTASTQNQAFNGLLFLYREVLDHELRGIDAVRADRPVHVPVVLTPQEVGNVLARMSGTPQLVVKLLYGSGLRLMEALRLRVKDLDFEMRQLTVRDGKGAKDRYTMLAEASIPVLREHLTRSPGWKACRGSGHQVELRSARLSHE